ncbi:hypothetical protein J9303_06310 [Bacillaceae bacterium Marseille-Q3522]|nr:hypothetical protein [Bacillaceae bacterium Marseille-Q3522]
MYAADIYVNEKLYLNGRNNKVMTYSHKSSWLIKEYNDNTQSGETADLRRSA